MESGPNDSVKVAQASRGCLRFNTTSCWRSAATSNTRRWRADEERVRVLAPSPAVLDVFTRLSYRCFLAKGEEQSPIFGGFGPVAQLGNVEYARPRRFREKFEHPHDVARVPGTPE